MEKEKSADLREKLTEKGPFELSALVHENNKIEKQESNRNKLDSATESSPEGNSSLDHDKQQGADNSRKRRQRRKGKGGKHHKKWKPYDKLTYTEILQLESLEARKREERMQQQVAKGQAMAPLNTSSFIMAQYDDFDVDKAVDADGYEMFHYDMESEEEDDSNFVKTSMDSSDEAEDPTVKEFNDVYNSVFMDRLIEMPHAELMKQYIDLENKVQSLQKELKAEKRKTAKIVDMFFGKQPGSDVVEEDDVEIADIKDVIQRCVVDIDIDERPASKLRKRTTSEPPPKCEAKHYSIDCSQ